MVQVESCNGEVIMQSVCNLCEKNIPSANLIVHVAHCQRSKTCNICGNRIYNGIFDDNLGNDHKLINCNLCKGKIYSCVLQDHMTKECPQNIINCGFCEIPLPRQSMVSHEAFCGARTDECSKCNERVCMKDFKTHESYCCRNGSSPQKNHAGGTSNIIDKRWSDDEDINLLDEYNNSKLDNMLSVMENLKKMSFPDGFDDIPCECCGKVFPASIYTTHQDVCQGRDSSGTKLDLPCQFCNKLISFTGLELHQEICRFREDVAVKLPCEFCSDCFPANSLRNHQDTCKFREEVVVELPCEFCSDCFPAYSLTNHQMFCPKKPKFGYSLDNSTLSNQPSPFKLESKGTADGSHRGIIHSTTGRKSYETSSDGKPTSVFTLSEKEMLLIKRHYESSGEESDSTSPRKVRDAMSSPSYSGRTITATDGSVNATPFSITSSRGKDLSSVPKTIVSVRQGQRISDRVHLVDTESSNKDRGVTMPSRGILSPPTPRPSDCNGSSGAIPKVPKHSSTGLVDAEVELLPECISEQSWIDDEVTNGLPRWSPRSDCSKIANGSLGKNSKSKPAGVEKSTVRIGVTSPAADVSTKQCVSSSEEAVNIFKLSGEEISFIKQWQRDFRENGRNSSPISSPEREGSRSSSSPKPEESNSRHVSPVVSPIKVRTSLATSSQRKDSSSNGVGRLVIVRHWEKIENNVILEDKN